MSAGGRLKALFQRRRSIAKVSLDELNKERAQLEQEEGRLASKVQQLESQKEALFAQGKDEPSQRQQMIIARKIKELDVQAKNYDKSMHLFSRQIRILNGFIQVKENQQFLKERGISSLINKMDLSRLQQYVEKASVEGQFQMDSFANILGTLEEPAVASSVTEEETDISAIVAAMQEARDAEKQSPETATDEGLKKVDKILAREKGEGESAI